MDAIGSNMVRLNLAILCHPLLTRCSQRRMTRRPVSQNATPPNIALMSRERDVTDSVIFSVRCVI